MGDNKSQVLYIGAYDDVNVALQDLDAFEQLHDDEVIGDYDAAVVDMEDGKPHIVKRVDHPRINVIAESFGHGNLPYGELHQAAAELPAGQAGLIVVGEPTIEKAWDKAVTRAAKTAKHDFNADTDEIAKDLTETLAK